MRELYNNWYFKATITVNNKMFNWKYENIWNTKWRIFNSEKINIEYAGSSSRGEIETGWHCL
ncbi:hypothetical protein SAMN05660903_02525 [Salegentibacter salinarum]|nr:hypothetical protein SAMN05660903_02525 [Salegentibacter salinarum]